MVVCSTSAAAGLINFKMMQMISSSRSHVLFFSFFFLLNSEQMSGEHVL